LARANGRERNTAATTHTTTYMMNVPVCDSTTCLSSSRGVWTQDRHVWIYGHIITAIPQVRAAQVEQQFVEHQDRTYQVFRFVDATERRATATHAEHDTVPCVTLRFE